MVAIRQVTDEEKDYIRENFKYDSESGVLLRALKDGKENICEHQNSSGYYIVKTGTRWMQVQ